MVSPFRFGQLVQCLNLQQIHALPARLTSALCRSVVSVKQAMDEQTGIFQPCELA